MKFTTAWAKIAAQNVTLKVATIALAVVSVTQVVVLITLTNKDLPLIERGCYSKIRPLVSSQETKSEIESFLNESLSMRFDSASYIKDGFLSLEELSNREKEQNSLKQKQITQKILIQEIKINDSGDITAYTDRLLAVGKIKSVLALNLKIILQKTNRTEANPYGLVLSSVSPLEEKETK